jgi:hypothetical protein
MLRAVSLLRPARLAVLLTLLTAAPAAAAGDPIMPLSQVARGMHCTGYSVIRGTDVSSFDVLIDDIVYDAADTADILVTVSGPAVDSTGVGPGFSGSPVYGPAPDSGTMEVIGALSFGIGDYDNKTLLATPIEDMLGEPVAPPPSARRARPAERRAKPLGTALTITGLSPRVAEGFQKAARRAGRELIALPAGPRATNFPVQTLVPGSAMAASYSSGDIGFGGIGTVTYVDGSSIWAFGHPLDSVGRRALFLQDAFVYGIINSPSLGGGQGTYKLAIPGHDIGTLSGDGVFSVGGTVGALPPHTPMTVTAHDLDSGATRTISLQLADERSIGNPTGVSPLAFVGAGAVAQAAYTILHGSPLNTSGNMCVRFSVSQRDRPLGFCNTYVAAGTGIASDGSGSLAGTTPVIDFGSAASLLDAYRLGPLDVTDVSVTLNLRRGLSQGFLSALKAPQVKLTRGKTYTVTLSYLRAGGAKGVVAVKVRVPDRMPRGKRDLVLTGTASDLAGGGYSALSSLLSTPDDEGGPRTLDALSKQIGAIHRYDGVTASFRPRMKKGEALSSPTSDDSLPGGAEGAALRERKVYRNPKLRLSGAVALPVVIR